MRVANCNPGSSLEKLRYNHAVSASCTIIASNVNCRVSCGLSDGMNVSNPIPTSGRNRMTLRVILMESPTRPTPQQRAHNTDHHKQRIGMQAAVLNLAQHTGRELAERTDAVQRAVDDSTIANLEKHVLRNPGEWFCEGRRYTTRQRSICRRGVCVARQTILRALPRETAAHRTRTTRRRAPLPRLRWRCRAMCVRDDAILPR